MTPNEMQNQINQLQAELDRLKQADTYFPESGEVVWVSDDLETWEKRIFIKFLGFNSSPYKCVWENKSNTTKNYLLGKSYITSDWAYCRRLDGEIIPFGRDKYKDPDYSHLLPDGYEFCKEEDADEETEIMYLKVKLHNLDPNEKPLGSIMQEAKHMEAFYMPIRKIQYHVAVHEAVTTEPNPYAVDWTNAPEWADSHCFDRDHSGWWYGAKMKNSFWDTDDCDRSGFTLPSGLDWKLSKTTRP
jgi:hypothetical protein